MKNKTQEQLLHEYKKECKNKRKEISGDDFINNFIPNYLKNGGGIKFNNI